MGCSTCGSGGCGTAKSGVSTAGCGSGGCSTGGCNKMNVYDWLGNMELPGETQKFNIVEVRFKGGRKEFFRNNLGLDLTTGDAIAVEVAGGGYHVGFVSLQGELVRLQMKRKGVKESSGDIKNIYRIATKRDMEKLGETVVRELPTLFRGRQIIDQQKVKMKLSDVEYQADNTKATFFYSADDRVDFRELIKSLAGEFKVRVEMRQISLRQEAGRLGGIGICGRELCCSTWLTDFKSVNTSAARYQNLSLNPAKLSGQCGRLKCCLNYELETYMDALKGIPTVDKPLLTEKGEAFLQKTDIFRRLMWFGYRDETNWYALPVERVNTILALNKAGQKANALTDEQEQALILAENAGPINQDLLKLDEKYTDRDKLRKQKQKEKEKLRKVAQASKTTDSGAKTDDMSLDRLSARPTEARHDRNRDRDRDRNRDRNKKPSGSNENRPKQEGQRPQSNAAPRAEGQPQPKREQQTPREQQTQKPKNPEGNKPNHQGQNNQRGPKPDRSPDPNRPIQARNQRTDAVPNPDGAKPNPPRPPRQDQKPLQAENRPPQAAGGEAGKPTGSGNNRNHRNRGRGNNNRPERQDKPASNNPDTAN